VAFEDKEEAENILRLVGGGRERAMTELGGAALAFVNSIPFVWVQRQDEKVGRFTNGEDVGEDGKIVRKSQNGDGKFKLL